MHQRKPQPEHPGIEAVDQLIALDLAKIACHRQHLGVMKFAGGVVQQCHAIGQIHLLGFGFQRDGCSQRCGGAGQDE